MKFDNDNLRYSYSYNLIAICGWVIIITILLFVHDFSLPSFLIYFQIAKGACICLALAFLLFIIEQVLKVKINKLPSMDTKLFKIFQQLGFWVFVVFFILISISFVLALLL